MNGLEVLQGVQFVTVKGKRLAILGAEDWETLIEWLENVEDAQIVKQSFAELKASHGDRQQAGWLVWDDVKDQIE